jgi:hypothetical protein
MIDFQCTKEECPNFGISYQCFGSSSWAECGGCKSILEGTNERPDPIVPEITTDLPKLPE